MLPVPRSANTPPVRCRHKVGGEQPPSAEQPALCASIRLLFSSWMNQSPTSRWHRHAAEGTFPHLRSSRLRAVLPHHGSCSCHHPSPDSCCRYAARLLRSNGSMRGTEKNQEDSLARNLPRLEILF